MASLLCQSLPEGRNPMIYHLIGLEFAGQNWIPSGFLLLQDLQDKTTNWIALTTTETENCEIELDNESKQMQASGSSFVTSI
jgi:hypothetical protein